MTFWCQYFDILLKSNLKNWVHTAYYIAPRKKTLSIFPISVIFNFDLYFHEINEFVWFFFQLWSFHEIFDCHRNLDGFPNHVIVGYGRTQIYWNGLQPFTRAFYFCRGHVSYKSGLFVQKIFLSRLVLLWILQIWRIY